MEQPKSLLEAAYLLVRGADPKEMGEWAAKNPRAALILRFYAKTAKKAGEAARGHVLEGFCEMTEKCEKYIYEHMYPEWLRNVRETAQDENDPDLVADSILEILEPADVWAAKNGMFLYPQIRAAIREALIDMGNRPAGDLTLESIVRSALRLILMREILKVMNHGDKVDPLN